MGKKELVIITGPTGSGKTKLSITVAKALDTEIINCDSRQIYKEFGVAVAKPSEEELFLVKHHFVSSHSIYEDAITAGEFARLSLQILEKLFQNKEKVVLCGGTGFYISALLNGFTIGDSNDKKNIRKKVDALYLEKGMEGVVNELKRLNPSATDVIDLKNVARVKRALEISLGEVQSKMPHAFPYAFKIFVLSPEREMLYTQINKRVDQMIQQGLELEAKELYKKIPEGLKTVGYEEMFEYFAGKWTRQEAIDKIKQHTRNYAKRQLTYARNQFKNAIWLEPNSAKDVIFANI